MKTELAPRNYGGNSCVSQVGFKPAAVHFSWLPCHLLSLLWLQVSVRATQFCLKAVHDISLAVKHEKFTADWVVFGEGMVCPSLFFVSDTNQLMSLPRVFKGWEIVQL